VSLALKFEKPVQDRRLRSRPCEDYSDFWDPFGRSEKLMSKQKRHAYWHIGVVIVVIGLWFAWATASRQRKERMTAACLIEPRRGGSAAS